MINSLLLVEDEDMFHLIFEDACYLLRIAMQLRMVKTSDEADVMFRDWKVDPTDKPDCVFVDFNLVGSSYDGVDLVRRINQIHGNGVVIGVISSSFDPAEIQRAKDSGAQFWLVKTEDLEPRLEAFMEDYVSYQQSDFQFRVYQ